MDASNLFAKNFYDVKYEDLSEKAIEETKKQVLDYIGVAIGGYGQAGAAETRELAIEWGGAPQSTIIGCGIKVPAPAAAQANASMVHSLDFDDVHEAAIMHPGVVTISSALAAGEYAGKLSGKELIRNVAVGGDMICRMGLATHPGKDIHQFGWHFTSINGYMTSAAVASCVMGLDMEKMIYAIGLAYHQSSGNGQAVKDSALTKRLGPGFAVRGGLASAMLAQRGVTGAVNSMEGVNGYYKVYHGGDYSQEILLGDLGKRFECEETSIKPYPCCRGTHPSADAALSLVRDYGVKVEDIESIEIFCGKGTLGLLGEPLEVKAKPRTVVDSQFSLAWVCATGLVKNRVSLASFTDESIHDPEILDVAAKVKVTWDAKYDTGGLEPVRIEVAMKDGRAYSVEKLTATGSPEQPVSFDGCIEKFYGCVDFSTLDIKRDKADKIVETVLSLDKLGDIGDLIKLLS
ncbi:MAG: MmgE/PrpD family protein [Oscillospiraceae bacterium]|nr:MmgE/PrpD family protein [Oscillospiraceae bacterium]